MATENPYTQMDRRIDRYIGDFSDLKQLLGEMDCDQIGVLVEDWMILRVFIDINEHEEMSRAVAEDDWQAIENLLNRMMGPITDDKGNVAPVV